MAVGLEVIGDEVVIAVLDDAVDEAGEGARVAESTGLDAFEDFVEFFVQSVCAVDVAVAEVFNFLGEIAEEEDVIFADFAGDFNLLARISTTLEMLKLGVRAYVSAIACSYNKTSVQDKLHVGSSRCLSSSS